MIRLWIIAWRLHEDLSVRSHGNLVDNGCRWDHRATCYEHNKKKKKKTTSRSLKRKKVFTKEKSSTRIGLVGNINMALARLPTSLDLVSFRVEYLPEQRSFWPRSGNVKVAKQPSERWSRKCSGAAGSRINKTKDFSGSLSCHFRLNVLFLQRKWKQYT